MAALIACGATVAGAQVYSGDSSVSSGATGAPALTQGEVQAEQGAARAGRRPLTVVADISVEETYTDNVDLRPSATRRSDFITQIAPRVRVSAQGAHTSVDAGVSVPAYVYARTGSENNRVVPYASVSGHADGLERRVFIDAAATVSQQYFSPFGARSVSLANRTDNEYRQETYRISPSFRGEASGDIRYEIRDDNFWSRLGSTPVPTSNSYTNELVADVARLPAPLGWSLNYQRSHIRFQEQPVQLTQIARARLRYAPNPQMQVFATGGYEDNRFVFSHTSNAVYGVGAVGRPTERTRLDAEWEHRFFGSSYRFTLEHRTPLTVWSASASRDITTSPQLLAQFPTGGTVPLLLNSLFASRIADPALRDEFVRQFMQDRGLPETLSSPFNIYSQQILLEERASATTGLIGARNAVFITLYYSRTERITGSGSELPPVFELASNSTQQGGSVSWSHNLSPLTALVATADYGRATGNGAVAARSTNGSVRANLVTRIGAYTSFFAGTRYQAFRSDIADDWRELAVYMGLKYVFH